MKRGIIFGGFIVALSTLTGFGQSRYTARESETIHRTLEFSATANRMVELDNINGSIHVTGTNGRSIEIIAAKSIEAVSPERLAVAKHEVSLDITDRAETVRIYVNGPERSHRDERGDDWRSSRNRWSDSGYSVKFDFEVQVPQGTKLRLRTINGSEIKVDNTQGDFEIENVNGKITMTDIRGSGSAHTVNGPARVSFLENPKSASSFKSVNGAIEVSFQPDLAAKLQMKTINGGLFTDFDVKALASPSAVGERVGSRFVLRSNQFSGFQVGNGGPEIKFDGFNGSVKVLRRTR